MITCTLRYRSNTEIFLADAMLVVWTGLASLLRLQNNKQKKEPLVHHAGNGESRPRFLPSSHSVVVKTKVLGNFLSILIFRTGRFRYKNTVYQTKCDRYKRKFPIQVNRMQ